MHLSSAFYSLREDAERLLYEPTAATMPDVVGKRVVYRMHLTFTKRARVGSFQSSHSCAPCRPADALHDWRISLVDREVAAVRHHP